MLGEPDRASATPIIRSASAKDIVCQSLVSCSGHGLSVPCRAPRGLGGMGTPRAASVLGGQPASSDQSRAEVAPGRRTRTLGGARRRAVDGPAHGRDASNRATRWYSLRPPARSRPRDQRAEPPPAVADLLGDVSTPASPRVSPASARPDAPRAWRRLAVCARSGLRQRLRPRTASPSSQGHAAASRSRRRSVERRARRPRSSSSSPRQLGGRAHRAAPAPRPWLSRRAGCPAGCRRGGSRPARRGSPRAPSTSACRRRPVPSPAADVAAGSPTGSTNGQGRRRQPPVHPGARPGWTS